MDKNLPLHLQEIIFSSSDPAISRAISKLDKFIHAFSILAINMLEMDNLKYKMKSQ